MRIAFVMYNVLSTERMSVMLLSALAKQHYPHAECEIFVYTDGRLGDQLKTFLPDIVAFTTMTGEHMHYLKIAREIREIELRIGKKMFLIMGGPHCTFAPQVLKGSPLDAIGVGECEDMWPQLLGHLEAGRNPDDLPNLVTQSNYDRVVVPANLKNERYVSFRATNLKERTCHDPINHIGCLDHLPFLDWKLFLSRTDFEKRNGVLKRTLMTRRGCPYPCTYCFNRTFNALHEGQTIHNFSIDRVIAECKWVGENWPTEFWKFYDDIFTFSSKKKEGDRLREFAEKWRREIDLPFFCLTRADIVARDPEILDLLHEAGCKSLTMSIEGGNEYVRNRVLERSMSDEDVIFAHRRAWDLGIYTFSNVIMSVPISLEEVNKNNLPARSLDRDIESVALCLKAKVHFLECPILMPYPGTKLYEYCLANGFFDGRFTDIPQSYQNRSTLDCFTDKEKRATQNLVFLAMWCVWLGSRKNTFVRKVISPIFFKLVTKFLIFLPWNWCTKLYFLMYGTLQQWLCVTEIYEPKYRSPFKALGSGFWGRLYYEYLKQFPKPTKVEGNG
ncbi:MAG: radical SAM protein [Candidatus Pacebacteria bacterium]|nr:radical SAM protein [Candidatus Paceibacterota bacterium]